MSSIAVTAAPRNVGMSEERLARLDNHLRAYVDDGRLPGWQIAIARHGEVVHLASYGNADTETAQQIESNTIFRIFSMTKPITSVAVMMLWEEGKLELTDPVSKFIPSFDNLSVWKRGSSTSYLLEPVTEPMRVWHLLTHTSGLTYGFLMAHVVDELYRKAGFEWGVPKGANLEQMCDQLAELPLLFQPGTEWNYSMATDVLGRVVEVASGQSLDTFFSERIFTPLHMVDTAFHVTEDKAHRLASLYGAQPTTKKAIHLKEFGAAALRAPTALLGGGGLVSTSGDYMRFADMLRRGGVASPTLGGERLLSPRTLAYMTKNHLPDHADLATFGRPISSETTYEGIGFGLGFSVTLDPVKAKMASSVGDFGWGGAASTAFTVDPEEDMVILFMTQLMPSSAHPLRPQIRQLVHQAIID
jgi:CubicO group peptidase (beta-lactamase class C family)